MAARFSILCLLLLSSASITLGRPDVTLTSHITSQRRLLQNGTYNVALGPAAAPAPVNTGNGTAAVPVSPAYGFVYKPSGTYPYVPALFVFGELVQHFVFLFVIVLFCFSTVHFCPLFAGAYIIMGVMQLDVSSSIEALGLPHISWSGVVFWSYLFTAVDSFLQMLPVCSLSWQLFTSFLLSAFFACRLFACIQF